MPPVSADDALIRLRKGNQRFASGVLSGTAPTGPSRRRQLVSGQEPFAVILGCADSRVPVELIFDQGLGDLFVIRVAGNIATPSVIGSVEFAAGQLGTRLVVVLGHQYCGAVQATVAELESPTADLSPNLGAIVEEIRPVVEPLFETAVRHDSEKLVEQAIRANVIATAAGLRRRSPLLDSLARDDGLVIIGAEYALSSGEVAFYEQA